jgi:hypothetical protein
VEISVESTFSIPESVAWRNVNEEIVILKLKSGEYYTLNEIGQHIWQGISDQQNVESILKQIVDQFDVTYDKVKEDVMRFLENMLKESIVLLNEN